MVAVRSMTFGPHPTTGVDGVWLEPSWEPVGTIIGLAFSEWPAPKANDTPATYTADINALLETRARRLNAQGQLQDRPILATVRVIALNPLTLDPNEPFTITSRDWT